MNWRAIAAGSLGVLMAGSTLAFAADLGDYPAPFVEDSTVNALFVVGASAATADVVGAINMAARLGGAPVTQTEVSVPGVTGTLSIDGEGRELSTKSTKIYLDDQLGKTGLRTTLTDDDMPTLLKDGTLTDSNRSTTHNYQQFIDLTPGSTSSANFQLQFDRPGSSSSDDGSYNFGRFPTSPSSTDYFYRTRVVFSTNVQGSSVVTGGDKVELFGAEYTFSTGTDIPGNKVVLFGGSETHVLSGGESLTVTIGGSTYTVTLVGTSSTTQAVVKVGSDQKTIAKSGSGKVGGLDVFISDVFHLSTTDQTQNSAKVILGAQKLTLQNGQKIKLGDNEDPVDGTSVALTRDSTTQLLSQITVYHGARSSSVDFLKEGDTYLDNGWGTFEIAFPSVDPSLDASSRNVLNVDPSGDNVLEMTWTDDDRDDATIGWAYKSASTGTAFSLAGTSGNTIHVQERASVGRDEYIILDAGDFPHMFRVSDVSLDGSSSASITLVDQFSGESVKLTTGSDNIESVVIDGQTYNIFNVSSTNFTMSWGNNSNISSTANGAGTFHTVYPKLKGKNGEYLAFFNNQTVSDINTNSRIQLPTGTISFNLYLSPTNHTINISAVNNEDGTGSAFAAADTVTNFNLFANETATFTLGRTASAGVRYQLKFNNGVGTTNSTVISVVGESGSTPLAQPGLILVEEKDDAGDLKAVIVTASTEASGSNNVAIPSTPTIIGGEDSQTRGTDSNIIDYVDLWGTWVVRKTSGQDTLDIYYPDDQVVAHLAVVKKGVTTTVSAGGASGSVTTDEIVPIKTSVAKLDTEVTAADKNTKNLILVGGPAVNMLVKDLGDAGKSWTRDQYISAGEGTAIIQLVEDAFASGRSALIVAGHSADDTRAVTSIMQNYDAYMSDLDGRTGVEVVNGAISGELA